MRVGRRTALALLFVITVFNLLLRYPQFPHEVGVDSFFVHTLSVAIVSDGYAKWILNPFSYFGWYPLSYPSADPFLLSSTSALGNINVEESIFIVSILLGPIGILSSFLMAREFRESDLFALGTAALYGLAPRFLEFTLWSASTRSLFMSLLPVFMWLLLANYRRRSYANLLLLAVFLVLLAATHRLVVLVAIVILAFIVAVIALAVTRILRIRFPHIILRDSFRRVTPHIVLGSVALIAATMIMGTNVLQEYTYGELASGDSPLIQLANLGVSIARSAGLALPLMFVGLVVIVLQRNKTITEPFLAVAFLGLIPTLFLRQYTGFYILPLLALLGGLGLERLIIHFRQRRLQTLAVGVGLCLCMSGFSVYVLNVEISRTSVMSSETYNTGLYVKGLWAPGTIVANDGLMGIRVEAISGAQVLPVGGAGTTFQSPELLIFGFYSPDELNSGIKRIALQDLTLESDSLWIAPDIQAELDWAQILQSKQGSISEPLNLRYRPAYLLELKTAPGRFLAYENVYCSDLGLWAHDNRYVVYDNGKETLWWLYTPGSSTPITENSRTCP